MAQGLAVGRAEFIHETPPHGGAKFARVIPFAAEGGGMGRGLARRFAHGRQDGRGNRLGAMVTIAEN